MRKSLREPLGEVLVVRRDSSSDSAALHSRVVVQIVTNDHGIRHLQEKQGAVTRKLLEAGSNQSNTQVTHRNRNLPDGTSHLAVDLKENLENDGRVVLVLSHLSSERLELHDLRGNWNWNAFAREHNLIEMRKTHLSKKTNLGDRGRRAS